MLNSSAASFARRVGDVHVVGLIGDAVFGEDETEGPEGGGLDRVHADREVLGVHLTDELGPGHHEVFVAAFEGLAAEVFGSKILSLDPGPEGPIHDQDAFGQEAKKVRHEAGKASRPARSGSFCSVAPSSPAGWLGVGRLGERSSTDGEAAVTVG